MKNFMTKKGVVLLIAIALLLAVAVGGTIAYLVDQTGEVVNTFIPTTVDVGIIEDLAEGKKRNVYIENTGSVAAYIRAKVVITWQDEDGNVYGQLPVENTNYKITWGEHVGVGETWIPGNDGFYYHAEPVLPAPSSNTTYCLVYSCEAIGAAPEGYDLHVEILAQAVQAVPTSVVESVWPVTVSGTTISPKND